MYRYFLRKRRLVTGAVAAVLTASAFEAGGCTINVDENLLRLIQGIAGDIANGPDGAHRPPWGPPPCGFECDEGGDDGWDTQENQPV
jgi:hypothetical protein